MGYVNPFSFEEWRESQTEAKVLNGMRERCRGHARASWEEAPGGKGSGRVWKLALGRVWEQVKGHQQHRRTVLGTTQNHRQSNEATLKASWVKP